MEFDIKKPILRLISSNKKGVSKEDMIEFLDYVNKIRYSTDEIDVLLKELIEANIIRQKNDELWYLS